jgi:predicted component of type VI protein secretion system
MRLRRRSNGLTRELSAGMSFGRLAECAWQVDDPSVSRRHARALLEGGEWWIEDLGSSNGTFLNGARAARHRLRAGDLLTLGAVAFDVLAAAGAPAQAVSSVAAPAPNDAPAPVPPTAAAPAPPCAAAAPAGEEEADLAAAERERARLRREISRPQRSRGFGDLSQQSFGMKLLALLIGLAVLAGVALGVRFVAGTL